MAYSGMPAMYAGTDGSGGFQIADRLTAMAFLTPQPKSLLRTFVNFRETLGKNAAEVVFRNRWGNFTAGGTIAESATHAATGKMILTQASATVVEFMNAGTLSAKLVALANMEVTDPIVTGLRDDEKKTIDAYLYTNVYNAGVYRYVGTATDGYALTSNGTATATCTSVLNSYHIRKMVLELKKMNAPANPATGNYTGVLSLQAADNIRDDATWKNVQLKDAFNGLVTGYLGSFQGVDWFEENSALSGAGVVTFTNYSGSGKALIFGDGFATEDLVIAPEIRTNIELAAKLGRASDFGRIIDLAWYEMAAFGTLWNVAGQCHEVVWDSA